MKTFGSDSNINFNDLKNKMINRIEFSGYSLRFFMKDAPNFIITDEGQSCCETRYMYCQDDLSFYNASTLLGIIEKPVYESKAPKPEYESSSHDECFLEIITSKGSFVCETHNEHNGYYGGFNITLNKF